jgi:hypothetical protein
VRPDPEYLLPSERAPVPAEGAPPAAEPRIVITFQGASAFDSDERNS